ncbi:MAG TPA: hypothetical protein VHC44_17390 [Verrucomicrobiae bacterium]|nr:hypothetical protein [Verrucomicrobiae bacterium]
MKKSPLAVMAAIIVLVAGCSTTSPSARSVSPATSGATRLAQSDLKIISAVYGSGKTFVDVTQRVDDLLNQLPKGFRARPARMLVNPTPNTTMSLVIVYQYKGQQHTLTKGQRGRVSIQILQEAANRPA